MSHGTPKAVRSHEDSGLASALERLSVSPNSPPQPPFSNKSVVLTESGALYLWDMDESQFKGIGEVVVSIIETEDNDCEYFSAFYHDEIICDAACASGQTGSKFEDPRPSHLARFLLISTPDSQRYVLFCGRWPA